MPHEPIRDGDEDEAIQDDNTQDFGDCQQPGSFADPAQHNPQA